MKALRKRTTWILLTLLLLPILAFGVWFNRKVKQQNLDRALIVAIKQNDTPTAIALLDEGADANATDKPYALVTFKGVLAGFWNRLKGKSPVKDKKHYLTALLLPYRRDIWNSSIAPHGAYILKPEPLDNPKLVKALLEHRANAYATDEDGDTVLHLACAYNHSNTVKLLLEHYVNPNVEDATGRTALFYANDECAQLLVEAGVDVNKRDVDGASSLRYYKTPNTLRLLLEHRADVNNQDNTGWTALYEEVGLDDSSEKVGILLHYGAKVSIKSRFGISALDAAKDNKNKAILPMLEAAYRKEQAQSEKLR